MVRPGELSRQLRRGTGGFSRRRRQVVGLSLGAMVPMGVVTLYQMGIIDHVPEPPLPGLDGDEVDAAPEAYAMLSTPDAVLGLGSYTITLVLAAMGDEDRATERPWIPLALAAITAFLAGGIVLNVLKEELPEERESRFWAFALGATSYATILLAL